MDDSLFCRKCGRKRGKVHGKMSVMEVALIIRMFFFLLGGGVIIVYLRRDHKGMLLIIIPTPIVCPHLMYLAVGLA